MILIADCGSTKIDWCLLNGNEKVAQIFTTGMNALLLTQQEMTERIHDELMPHIVSYKVDEIYYYGAGIISDEIKDSVRNALKANIPTATKIEVDTDLLAAARALCGREPGIACILGTGSNSCYYDGEKVVDNVSPLGYILGDEGSGAVLGIRFLNALYKGQLDEALRHAFEAWAGLALPDVIARVYRQPLANRWLASLSPFIHQHISQRGVQALVVDNFRDFIRRNIVPYRRPDLPLNAVGSIACHYQPQLQEAARQEGYAIGVVVRSPLDRLTMPTVGC